MDEQNFDCTMRGLIRVLLDYPMNMKIDYSSAHEILEILETVYIHNDPVMMDAILHPDFGCDADLVGIASDFDLA